MRAAGFKDFERGERGSTAEHLDVLEYKNKQETERAAALSRDVQKKEVRLGKLDEKIAVKIKAAATVAEIDGMAKKTIGGKIQLSPDNWKRISDLAKEGVKSHSTIKELKEKGSSLIQRITGLENRLQSYEGKGITDTMRYYQAQQRAPKRLTAVIDEILRQPPEKQEERSTTEKKRSTDLEI
jgi:hypothetical protein